MKRALRLRIFVAAFVGGLTVASGAHADPLSQAILAAFAITASTTGYATIVAATTFLIQSTAAFALSAISSALFGPKSVQQDRQASVTSLQIGETPREFVFGTACTAGSLLHAFNFGGTYGSDWECLLVALADHPIDSIQGFYVNDDYHDYVGDGGQAAFSNYLDLEFINGSLTPDLEPSRFTSHTDWASTDLLIGVAHIWIAYKYDEATWPQGRPSFKWVLKGKRLYDPRKDSTVAGGSGSHRLTDPSTYEWSRNAAIVRYNWLRGIYAGDQVTSPGQLLIGRGLSELEAPPAAVFPWANLCDEDVPLKAGGSEKRYCADGVIRADETFEAIEEKFAAAMAGVVIQPNGGIDIEPGHSKSTVMEITDEDLIAGTTTTFSRFLSEDDPNRKNTVVPRYVEPTQLWQDHAAPVRRNIYDIEADGGPEEEDLQLDFVISGTQAQRCAEIKRRLNRVERRAACTLGPTASGLEDGDWIGWTSDRYHEGERVVYRVEAWGQDKDWRMALSLRETSYTAYTWTPADDEYTPGAAPPPDAVPLAPLALAGVSIIPVILTASGGAGGPALQATWSTPVDPAVYGIRLETRRAGESEVSPSTITSREGIDSGRMISTNGVYGVANLEARLLPLGDPSRPVAASDWVSITSGAFTAADVTHVDGVGAASLVTNVNNAAVTASGANAAAAAAAAAAAYAQATANGASADAAAAAAAAAYAYTIANGANSAAANASALAAAANAAAAAANSTANAAAANGRLPSISLTGSAGVGYGAAGGDFYSGSVTVPACTLNLIASALVSRTSTGTSPSVFGWTLYLINNGSASVVASGSGSVKPDDQLDDPVPSYSALSGVSVSVAAGSAQLHLVTHGGGPSAGGSAGADISITGLFA